MPKGLHNAMKRPTSARLLDPRLSHERLAAREYGAKPARDIDEDNRIASWLQFTPDSARPRVTGNWGDGSAQKSVAAALSYLGMIVDETQDAGPLPLFFENNAPLFFRGVPPSISAGGATVIGTGGAVTLNDATDNSGRITLVTGTGVSAAGVICTITFDVPRINADYGVFLTAADSDAAGTAGQSVYSDFATRTTTEWVLSCGAILASSTSYHWDFLLIGRGAL